jgi:hypothetical protein
MVHICQRRKKNSPREQIVDHTTDEDIEEEGPTRDAPTVTNTCVMHAVQSVEKRAIHQVERPDHRRRRREEAATDTTHRETNKLCGHEEEPLVYIWKYRFVSTFFISIVRTNKGPWKPDGRPRRMRENRDTDRQNPIAGCRTHVAQQQCPKRKLSTQRWP